MIIVNTVKMLQLNSKEWCANSDIWVVISETTLGAHVSTPSGSIAEFCHSSWLIDAFFVVVLFSFYQN